MKLQIVTTPKTVEIVNVLLARAIESVSGNKKLQKQMGITDFQLDKAKLFRHNMLDSFLNNK